MKNRRAFYTLLLIMAAGITITTCTNHFLRGSLDTEITAETAYEQAVYGETALSEEDGGAVSGGVSGIPDQEKQTAAPKGKIPERLAADGKAAGKADAEEDRASDTGAMEDSAMVKSAMPEAASGGDEPVLTSGSEDSGLSAASMEPEAGAGGEAFDGESRNSSELRISADSQEKKLQDGEANVEAEAVIISPLETSAPQGNGQKAGTVKPSYYRNRLAELDAQIQKSRDSQASNSVNAGSVTQSSASNELKLWDNELNVIYDAIMERLDEKQAGELVEEERQWMKERDRLASEAAKASLGDAQESVEYTASLAESTRLRAYELVEAYEYLLAD